MKSNNCVAYLRKFSTEVLLRLVSRVEFLWKSPMDNQVPYKGKYFFTSFNQLLKDFSPWRQSPKFYFRFIGLGQLDARMAKKVLHPSGEDVMLKFGCRERSQCVPKKVCTRYKSKASQNHLQTRQTNRGVSFLYLQDKCCESNNYCSWIYISKAVCYKMLINSESNNSFIRHGFTIEPTQNAKQSPMLSQSLTWQQQSFMLQCEQLI